MAEQMAGHPDRVMQLFDAKAPTWSAKYAPAGRLTSRLSRLAAAVSYHVPADGRVLDLGCGTGELARTAVTAGLRVTACDISPEMLRRAADRDPAGAVEWVQLGASWRTLPFEPATFDAVVASSVLEYVHRPDVVLSECSRVLRQGGFVLCTVPDPAHPARWLEWLAGKAARVPQVRAAGRLWPRMDRYLTYIQISQQRRPARWWCDVAARAGLLTVPRPSERSPLRLLTFQRSNEMGDIT